MKFNKNKYSKMDLKTKQACIKYIKDKFQQELSQILNLMRVSAPMFVTVSSGLQDNLSGVERSVKFDIKKDGEMLEIVQSLAKWKRNALKEYGIKMHYGIYTDMNAIRRDDDMDELHSIYVDQWDWERVISPKDRNIKYLKYTVDQIWDALKETSKFLKTKIKTKNLPTPTGNVFYITTQDLLDMYPNKSPKEREYEIVKKHKVVFIIGIGDKLSNKTVHDLRAPDYDDWALNGDLLVYHDVLDCCLELSSMGIRVNDKSLKSQLKKANKEERLKFQSHKDIDSNKLPLAIGGGVGQSRLCMYLMGRAHIGEVQSSYWDKENKNKAKKYGCELL